jgi:hypothetical protein
MRKYLFALDPLESYPNFLFQRKTWADHSKKLGVHEREYEYICTLVAKSL